MGKPWKMATDGPDTFSCAGLMRYIMRTIGVDGNAPWVPEGYLSAYAHVDPANLQPGDVVIYPDWATMYAGNGMLLNSNQDLGYVTLTPMSEAGTPEGMVRPPYADAGQPSQGGTAQQPLDGTATQQPLDGTATQQPLDGTATQQPLDGTTPQQPLDGTTPQQPLDGTATQQPLDGTATQQPLDGTAMQQPLDGTATQQPPVDYGSTPQY